MTKHKSKTVGYLLALLLGGIGIHQFYYRNYVRGILYLLFCWTYVPIFLGWIDLLFIHKWTNRINSQQQASGNNVIKNDKEKDVKETSTKNVEHIVENDKTKNDQRVNELFPKISGEKRFYSDNDIILPKYQHLQTPREIVTNVEAMINQKKEKSRSGITISYSSTQTDFAMDSFRYRKRRQVECQEIPLHAYWTTFGNLNEKQLKWYFYWREQALKGNYLDVDLSYLILFTYELMNYTFHRSAAFNVSMMVKLRDNYKERIPKVENYLPNWIGDMLLELEEKELASEWVEEKVYTPPLYNQLIEKKDALEKVSFTTWKPFIQNYRETTFFLNNKNKVYKTFKESIPLLKEYHAEQGKELEEVWFEKVEQRDVRRLFTSAVIARETSDIHAYTVSYKPTNKLYKEITTLFRISENVTRSLNGEKREIKVEDGILPEDFKQKMINRLEQAKTTNKRFKVVQEKENTSSGSAIPQPPKEESSSIEQTETKKLVDIQFNDDIIEETIRANKSLQEEFVKFDNREEESEPEKELPIPVSSDNGNVGSSINDITSFGKDGEADMNDLTDFVASLSDTERAFLVQFNMGRIELDVAKQFLKQKGKMMGMFLSELNEKANGSLGDNLLSEQGETITIYEEFEQVVGLVKSGIDKPSDSVAIPEITTVPEESKQKPETEKVIGVSDNGPSPFQIGNMFDAVEAGQDEMNEFVESLSKIEMEFLSRFENNHINSNEAKLFVKQQGQMLGMFLTELNEKSNEYLGDNLLEEQGEILAIYEEFEEVIALTKERFVLED
ncbi:TerB N-terminal domain-containing protein [Peribacillus frigoritolerans]|uniref:TerB N-terminal domain-containing protein n=1 Tax=Peribacillus frigoritolerans TaxID=450367 RepID=UPI00207ADE95|nr:TerB N-terminal domain-containing protein [Peribacillus frigoritolerans]USK62841.1 TerB N-terminal domain-containing protein [Peribacillus frigoritolerans]